MFNSLNKVTLIGKTSHKFPPELKVTPSGTSVLRFSMATTEVSKDKEGNKKKLTEYHRVVIWGKLAELGERFIKADTLVYIEGKLRTNKYTDKEGKEVKNLEVIADNFVILDSTPYDASKSNGGGSSYSNEPAHTPRVPASTEAADYDDDIPF